MDTVRYDFLLIQMQDIQQTLDKETEVIGTQSRDSRNIAIIFIH